MSTQVANLNIGALTVGQSSSISFGATLTPPTIEQQMRPAGNTAANLFLFNESGSGLKLLFPVSGESLTLAAGQWRIVSIPPNETQLNFSVLYVLPNAPVTTLLADLYLPGETIDAIGVLGNSPIGVTGSVPSAVTQVIQDGQANGLVIVEATPTGQPQNVKLTTDGVLKLGGAIASLGGQSMAGNFGVPVVPVNGLAIQVHVTTTGVQTILAATTASVAALYRVGFSCAIQVSGNITAKVAWTDPVVAGSPFGVYVETGANRQLSALALTAPYVAGCAPIQFYAQASTTITCSYGNSAVSPNDFVNFYIERLQ